MCVSGQQYVQTVCINLMCLINFEIMFSGKAEHEIATIPS